MKKLYSLVFILSMLLCLDNINASNCYYKDDVNGLYFYASVDDTETSPVVLIEKDFKGEHDNTNHTVNKSKWTIDNWKRESFDEMYPAYYPNGSCPKYLVYEQNSGFLGFSNKDYVYFADSAGVYLANNSYLLSNYNKSTTTPSNTPDNDTSNLDYSYCPYTVTLDNGEKVNFTINMQTREMIWKRGDTVIGSGRQVKISNPSFMFSFSDQPFPVGENQYTLFEYYAENKQCPGYQFSYNRLDGVYTLVYPGLNIDGLKPTENEDPNYKSEHTCLVQFSASSTFNANNRKVLELKLEKGTTNRICLRFVGDSAYSCSSGWNTPAILYDKSSGNNIKIQFEDSDTANYYFNDFINQGKCPNINNTDIFVNVNKSNYNEYTISRNGNNTTTTNPEEFADFSNSDKYRRLLGGLKNPLSLLSTDALSYELILDGNSTNLNAIENNNDVCEMTYCTAPKYQTEQAIRKVRKYCNLVYSALNANIDNIKDRVNECDSFDKFYNTLVDQGIISNLASGCGFVTENLKDFLNEILNYIKIGGPIIAIILGMVDFVKVVASGDPDKNMQDAKKRLGIRLIAAVLLVLVPIILSTVLNIFIGDKLENDPFCEVIKK